MTMDRKIRKVGVLGAGTMGAQIAAHLANSGIPSVLLDLPQDGKDKSALARLAVKRMTKMKPPPFYWAGAWSLIHPGNLADDLPWLGDCDWVVEAIAERMDVKRDLWEKVEPHLGSGTIVSSNTSGLSIAGIARDRSPEFRRHWLGTHFFNPPRYMKLLEIIPGPDTHPEIVKFMSEFGDRKLGKGIVVAKDQPNFVANRIGAFAASLAMHLTETLGLSIEEVDALTGPVIGRPTTATFRLADLIGNDVMCHVSDNLYENLPEDPWRELLAPPDLLRKLVERGWNGRKTGQGYYLKKGREFLVLDLDTMEYRSQQPVEIASLAAVKAESDPIARIQHLIQSGDQSEAFLWPLFRDTFAYSAGLIGDICDHLYQVDQAMRWGWAWGHGPFELWDALGAGQLARRIREDGVELPAWVETVSGSQSGRFYVSGDPPGYFDLASSTHQDMPQDQESLHLEPVKASQGVILSNPSASLIDLGDGVACLEFHSKMNTIDSYIVDLGLEATERVGRDFRALVIGNQGINFSAGANLAWLLEACGRAAWQGIDEQVRAFQEFCQGLKNAPFPVVAAPFRQTLAGGAEVCLPCDQLVSAAETYIGLVEVGVGLIPAGGGCTEMLLRNEPSERDSKPQRQAGVVKVFQVIGMAKVAGSAVEARELGFLRAWDQIEVSEERLLYRAKQRAVGLSSSYRPPDPAPMTACGEPCLARLKVTLHLMHRAGYLSDHDVLIGRKLALVLSGGDLNHATLVTEQHFLDLEREAFLSLCGEEKTQQRMEHILKTGKPLRN
jgi:3-hydroxyacyl-CoA dehydrogenase